MEQHPSYVAQERIKSIISRRLSMASSRVHGRDLRSSALPSLALIFKVPLRSLCLHSAHIV